MMVDASRDEEPRYLKIALVAMPWCQRDRPSSALAALKAMVRRERPCFEISALYEYVALSDLLGRSLYEHIAATCHNAGEACYTSLYYPEKAGASGQFFSRIIWAREGLRASSELECEALAGGPPPADDAGWFQMITSTLAAHVESLCERLRHFDVVGLTTSFGQLFANLLVARRLKEIAPHVHVVLGGSSVSSVVGPSLLDEYSQIDSIIQGEGELPFLALLDALARSEPPPVQTQGLLTRARLQISSSPVVMQEIPSLDELPVPDYDEYAHLADEHNISWLLPFEGSRGCWWDRTRRAGNPKNTCYFCNLNIQWNGYREKTPARVAQELTELVRRYRRLDLYFVDNIMRHTGASDLARELRQQRLDITFFYEMRVNIKPIEFLDLVEAGLTDTQFGIESLSTSYLHRFGKGTTTIQNLQAMRLCAEFNVRNHANLLIDFPGGTTQEVDEMCQVIEAAAFAFEPLEIASFGLGLDSTVDKLRDEFGVVNVRNRDFFRILLPQDLWERLILLDRDFDMPGRVDWSPVRQAVERWSSFYGGTYRPLLTYRDASDFVAITDARSPERSEIHLEGHRRELYLYCTEVRTLDQIKQRFAKAFPTEQTIVRLLDAFIKARLVFREGNRYLSLAVAAHKQVAARRIRAQWEEAQKESSPAPRPARAQLKVI